MGHTGGCCGPSDGKIPRSIAYVQCAGSRDQTLGVPYCSRVCCMYSIKQAILLLHLVHGVEITIYHMDIRAFGKNFEQFYQRAKAEGIHFVKGKVAKIAELTEPGPEAAVEDIDHGGGCIEPVHDLVVLALGADARLARQWASVPIEEAADGFFLSTDPKTQPGAQHHRRDLRRGRGDRPQGHPGRHRRGRGRGDGSGDVPAAHGRQARCAPEVSRGESSQDDGARTWTNRTTDKPVKEKKPMDILRERHGGMTDEMKAYFKEQNRVRKAAQRSAERRRRAPSRSWRGRLASQRTRCCGT